MDWTVPLASWAQPLKGRGGPDPQNLDEPPNFLRSFLMSVIM